MRRISWIVSALVLVFFLSANGRAGDSLFQYSSFDALRGGLYDGRMTLETLKFRGDFGLGFLNGLDGELTLLEGQAYKAEPGGKVSSPANSSRIPFATVAFFNPENMLKLGKIDSLEELNKVVSQGIPSPNLFCAIRIDANFPKVKTRSIPKQTAPYQSLVQVEKKQVVTELSGPGTLVGFYLPEHMGGIASSGFHWHFLTKDRSGGGHVLDLSISPATACLDVMHTYTVRLPDDLAFERMSLPCDRPGKTKSSADKQ